MGSIQPYYRRRRPAPQTEADFLRDVWLRELVSLVRSGTYPTPGGGLAGVGGSVRAMMTALPPLTPGSMRGLAANLLIRSGFWHHIDLWNAHLEPYGTADPVAAARAQFDKRAAAAIFCKVGPHLGVLTFEGYAPTPDAPYRNKLFFALEPTNGVGDDHAGGRATNTLRALKPGETLRFATKLRVEQGNAKIS